VYGEFGQLVARLDMGWPDMKIALEYEGDHHRNDRWQFNRDITRTEELQELGWTVIRVIAAEAPGFTLALSIYQKIAVMATF